MTGPEHFREGERLLDRAEHFIYGDGADPVVGAAVAQQAQAHFMAALVASQAASTQSAMFRALPQWAEIAGDQS